MIDARRDGLYLVAVGALIFVLFGATMQFAARESLADFRAIYFPAKTLVHGRDPFNAIETMRIYRAEGLFREHYSSKDLEIATVNVYPPSTLFLVAPLALLPSRIAAVLWAILTFTVVVIASLLMWELSVPYSPLLAGALIGLVLLNGILLAVTGNVAGIAIGASAIGVWCFVRERFVFWGILGLALGLALKPHDTVFVWLALLLTGDALRRRALQSLLAATLLSLPGIIYTWFVAPHWIQEWNANLAVYSARGGINDPGLLSSGGHGLDSLISLQTVFSVLKDDPRFYNAAADIVCIPLLLWWALQVLRHSQTIERTWLALAAVAPLSLLPIYHRQVDAILLLLAIPGCAVVQSWRGFAGRASVAITAGALTFSGIFCLAGIGGILLTGTPKLPYWGTWWTVLMEIFPAPLILLLMATFFLWQLSRQRA